MHESTVCSCAATSIPANDNALKPITVVRWTQNGLESFLLRVSTNWASYCVPLGGKRRHLRSHRVRQNLIDLVAHDQVLYASRAASKEMEFAILWPDEACQLIRHLLQVAREGAGKRQGIVHGKGGYC